MIWTLQQILPSLFLNKCLLWHCFYNETQSGIQIILKLRCKGFFVVENILSFEFLKRWDIYFKYPCKWTQLSLPMAGAKWYDPRWLWTTEEEALWFEDPIAWWDWMEPCGILWKALDARALPFELALILDVLFPMVVCLSYLDIQIEHSWSHQKMNIFVVFSSCKDSLATRTVEKFNIWAELSKKHVVTREVVNFYTSMQNYCPCVLFFPFIQDSSIKFYIWWHWHPNAFSCWCHEVFQDATRTSKNECLLDVTVLIRWS